jgi:hypothetical protein
VKKLTDSSYQRAKELLSKYKIEYQLLAGKLLEYVTLTGDEVRQLIHQDQKPKCPVINKHHGARGKKMCNIIFGFKHTIFVGMVVRQMP